MRNTECGGSMDIVVKKIADNFWVKTKDGIVLAKPRGTMKARGIFVGDKVKLNSLHSDIVIEHIEKRHNLLIRPPLANLDQLVIVLSPMPRPDFYVLDKLMLFSYAYDIEPILVVNKQDLSDELNDYVTEVYKPIMKVVLVSAKTGYGIEELKFLLRNKLSAFAGQSAVGKSALINSIMGEVIAKEGEISKKVKRGKNTTRHCEIFCKEDILIADTAGFTSLDETLLPIPYYELPLYYKDYLPYMSRCRYSDCKHISEDKAECAVKTAVCNGQLDKARYNRYTEIYKILMDKWVRTHG